MMAIYVFDPKTERMVNKSTGEPMVTGDWEPSTPMTFGDLPEYRSPIDGSLISGRRARKYDMEKNNCIDANDISTPKKLKNERFAKKYGVEHLLER